MRALAPYAGRDSSERQFRSTREWERIDHIRNGQRRGLALREIAAALGVDLEDIHIIIMTTLNGRGRIA